LSLSNTTYGLKPESDAVVAYLPVHIGTIWLSWYWTKL